MCNEIIDAVIKLNEVFFDEDAPMDFLGFEYKSTGFWDAVFFMGIRLWTDDDDTRVFYEETNEYESYFECFKREALLILGKVRSVKKRLEACSS
jgi:hypothetical protein